MLELWKLKRKRAKMHKRVAREINEVRHTDNPHFLDEFVAERTRQIRAVNHEIRQWHTTALVGEAESLDVELPEGDIAWQKNEDTLDQTLTTSGRATLRRHIAGERTRRREVKAWWWKNVVIPAITALTGLAGVITGMIAVIHAKK